MRKVLLVLALLLVLTGCQQKITTYNEVIIDGEVEIDGISYDIKSVLKSSYVYDNNDNLQETITKYDDYIVSNKYYYKNNQLVEEKKYQDDEHISTIQYSYENDKLIEKKFIRQLDDTTTDSITEYTYGDNTQIQTNKDSYNNILSTYTMHLDESDKILGTTHTNANGERGEISTYYYENNVLIKIIREGDGVYNTTFNYKYNNIGDLIMEYDVFYGEKSILMAVFYDYEYNRKLLPETLTLYRVQAPIDEENIRDN